MKKYYFLTFFLSTATFFSLLAQVQKGGHFISGSIDFSINQSKYAQKGNAEHQNGGQQMGVNLGYSYMVTNNWAVGGGLSYLTSRSANDVYNVTANEIVTLKIKDRSSSVYASASYFYPLGENGKWMASLGSGLRYGFGSRQTDTLRTSGTINVQSPRSQSLNLSFTPSIIYALSKHVFAVANVGSLNFSYAWSSQQKRTDINLYLYPSWGSFGFLYYW